MPGDPASQQLMVPSLMGFILDACTCIRTLPQASGSIQHPVIWNLVAASCVDLKEAQESGLADGSQ